MVSSVKLSLKMTQLERAYFKYKEVFFNFYQKTHFEAIIFTQ